MYLYESAGLSEDAIGRFNHSLQFLIWITMGRTLTGIDVPKVRCFGSTQAGSIEDYFDGQTMGAVRVGTTHVSLPFASDRLGSYLAEQPAWPLVQY